MSDPIFVFLTVAVCIILMMAGAWRMGESSAKRIIAEEEAARRAEHAERLRELFDEGKKK